MRRSEIRYAVSGEHHIAYRVLEGDRGGTTDLVMITGGNFPMDSLEGDPLANRLVEGLAALGRLVMFDRRGIGLSDPITTWDGTLREQWENDLLAVIDAAGFDRPSIISFHLMGVAPGFAVRWPDRVDRLVLWNPMGGARQAEDESWLDGLRSRQGEWLSGPGFSAAAAASRWNDPTYREWHDAAGRAGASPREAARMLECTWLVPPLDLTALATPTLVLTRVGELAKQFGIPADVAHRAAAAIPGAVHVQLPDGDFVPFGEGVDLVLEEVSRYLTGRVQLPEADRQLAAIVFTDLVGSTERVAREGDQGWKRLLDRHDDISRTATHRHRGTVVKSTGDGILALFPSTAAAVAAARAVRTQLDAKGLAVRVGIHVGEVDRRGDDVSGLALHAAARVMAQGAAGEIVLSEMAVRLAGDLPIEPMGERTLKGFDEPWTLYRLV